uniref:Uncharacterized protein n=1 Tax=Oryza barthii TaxID=65489 RepID=A0A0D3HNY1_9ORYZ
MGPPDLPSMNPRQIDQAPPPPLQKGLLYRDMHWWKLKLNVSAQLRIPARPMNWKRYSIFYQLEGSDLHQCHQILTCPGLQVNRLIFYSNR